MAFEVEFANVKLHEYFNILQVKRTILPSRTNFTKEIPSVDGQLYTGYKYEPKRITLSCFLTAEDNNDFADKIRNIAFVLDTKEPSKLILGDSLDMYSYAVVEGDTDIAKICKLGKFDINFICYDPISYSIEEDEFVADNNKIITVENGGTTDAYPKTSVEFSKNAHFLQCTNYDGKTILVGTPPSVEKTKVTYPRVVLDEHCETLTGWVNTSNVLDANEEITGNLVINQGGWGICLGNAGEGSSWHGGALRKNLGENVKQFKIEVKMEHNSKGDTNGTGSTSTVPPVSNTEYIITAVPSLRVRSGRGTNYSKIGSYKKGTTVTVVDIQNKWGKVTYNGQTGYIHMDYVKKKASSTTIPDGTYKVNLKDGVVLRDGRGTSYKKLLTIPNTTLVSITNISNNWGKTTYSGKTGYIAMQYMSKVDTNTNPTPNLNEDRLGVVEVYGYDIGGNKLFKVMLTDYQQFHEYTEPVIYFGDKIVLGDGKKCPAPKTVATKDDQGKTITKKVDSGRYGDWNEFFGYLTIERKTKNNKQYWKAKAEKISNGRIVRKIQTQTLSGNYPTGDLNNLVIFIGGHATNPLVDAMSVCEIKVTDIQNPPTSGQVKPIFKQGDDLVIDCVTQKIYKNGKLFMTELDIGSQFFSSPVGESQFICRSDDKDIDVMATIQKRWL